MNAILLLIKEHEKVRAAMAEITDDSHRFETRKKMFQELSAELIRHETMEQSVWYPQIQINAEVKNTIEHLIAEEKSAAKTVNAIKNLSDIKEDDKWLETFMKLKKDVEHHADEEETALFPKVARLIDEKELERIGKEMYDFKQEYKV